MATMNISLPDQMKDWVETQARSGRYGNASDYVRDLIRHDQEVEAARARLLEDARKAIASGFVDDSVEDVRKSARRALGLD